MRRRPDDRLSYFLVVLYKMHPEASPTLRSFLSYAGESASCSRLRLVIWDNSPSSSAEAIDLLRSKYSRLCIRYVHTPENRSLSSIYNELGEDVDENSYLTLLDQDTSLPVGYFDDLLLAQFSGEELILPKVMCSGQLVSPGARFFARGKLLNSVGSGRISTKNLLAINSGMSIRGDVLKRIKYDERLRFYGTDTFFMKRYERLYPYAYVLDHPVEHSLAVMDGKDEAWHRAYVEEMFRTFRFIYTDSLGEKLFVRLYYLFYLCKRFFLRLRK